MSHREMSVEQRQWQWQPSRMCLQQPSLPASAKPAFGTDGAVSHGVP